MNKEHEAARKKLVDQGYSFDDSYVDSRADSGGRAMVVINGVSMTQENMVALARGEKTLKDLEYPDRTRYKGYDILPIQQGNKWIFRALKVDSSEDPEARVSWNPPVQAASQQEVIAKAKRWIDSQNSDAATEA